MTISLTHLEDNVLLENVFDASDLVLRLALCKVRRRRSAIEYTAVGREFGHLCQLLNVSRLLLFGSRCLWCWRGGLGNGGANGIQSTGTCEVLDLKNTLVRWHDTYVQPPVQPERD